MNYEPSDLGSLTLLQITPKERTLSVQMKKILAHTSENRNETQNTDVLLTNLFQNSFNAHSNK